MKKVKSSFSSFWKERSRSPSGDSKPKRVKLRSQSRDKEKNKEENKSVPRKTRWQAADNEEVRKSASIPQPETQKEKSGRLLRITDSLHDKEKIVDLLFQTVTGAALQELIPDYLKNRSQDELKKLCLIQIKAMTDEAILQIISGKVDSSNKDEEKNVEKEQILKPEQPSLPKEKEDKKEVIDTEKKPEEIASVKLAGDISKPPKTRETKVRSKLEEENLIPLAIKYEVAKDLIQPERDAELLELEMRARAIRSLLKSKTQSANAGEIKQDK